MRLTNRGAATSFAALALIFLVGYGPVLLPNSVTESTTPPENGASPWLDASRRSVAYFDTSAAEYVGEPWWWGAGKNGSITNDFLRFGSNALPMDTAGVAENAYSTGMVAPASMRFLELFGGMSGSLLTTHAAACTLWMWATGPTLDAVPARLIGSIAFTNGAAPQGDFVLADSGWTVDPGEIVSVSMTSDGNNILSPQFFFCWARTDTLP